MLKSGTCYLAVIIAAGSEGKSVLIKLSKALNALTWQ